MEQIWTEEENYLGNHELTHGEVFKDLEDKNHSSEEGTAKHKELTRCYNNDQSLKEEKTVAMILERLEELRKYRK